MVEVVWNLLTEPLFRVRLPNTPSTDTLSLPALLAALSDKGIDAFLALQPHQSHAWHAFLVQLAAMALHRSGRETPPKDEPTWQILLRGLTPDHTDDAPWCLVVKDLAKPAFMQPPVPEGSLKRFKGPLKEPDRVDVLITAKNHDIKITRIQRPETDHWIYALMSVQTMGGFFGSGNYGIARMNGGFSSRPNVGLSPGVDLGRSFCRDCAVLLASYETIRADYGYPERNGLTLLWVEAWDGTKQLPLSRLDPYFLEICRRFRLTVHKNNLGAWLRPSAGTRILAKESKGRTGDPWVPIKGKEKTSLSVSRDGFTYKRIRELVFGEGYDIPPALHFHAVDRNSTMELVARCLVRGQGKTEGYHERRIPMPSRARSIFSDPKEREKLAKRAKNRVEEAAVMNTNILNPALLTLLQCVPEKLNWKDRRADGWRGQFETLVDQDFFNHLWADLARHSEEARHNWQQFLWDCARKILTSAEGAISLPAARRYKAIAAAERIFHGAVRKHFEDLYPQTVKRRDESDA